MTKEQIRIKMKEQRKNLTESERSGQDQSLHKLFLRSGAYKACEALFSFVSFGTEIDTHAIIRQAFLDQKKVYIPRVDADGMDFFQIHSLEGLIPSKFGVPEPEADATRRYRINPADQHAYTSGGLTKAVPDTENVMLLPGLAFDCQGNRIGYGAGYYDRYLSGFAKEHFYKIALAYDFQLLEQIEAEAYDQRAHLILTPTRIIDCSRKGGCEV